MILQLVKCYNPFCNQSIIQIHNKLLQMSSEASSTTKKNKLSVNNFRSQMQKIKMPFIQNIKKSADDFHYKIKQFEQKINSSDIDHEESMRKQYKQQRLDTEQNADVEVQEEVDILQKRMQSKKEQANQLRQWKGNLTHSFANMEEIQKNFIYVFQKKLSIKKKESKAKCYDFKDDQKQMLSKIFVQIKSQNKSKNKSTVLIQDVIKFFEQNQLFYLFYNLHPNRLRNILKQFARTQNDSLTLVQFLLVFYMDRPLLLNLKDPNFRQINRKCILDIQGWQQLKSIFTTLDTFGNETIHIMPFFQKLKTYHSNPNLIHSPVIQFPEIERFYTLKKVVFDLENKFKFLDKVQWKDIQNIILNFHHKQQPTLDAICEQNLQKATILLQSNYFLIDSNIIQLLKTTFDRCPKYCDFFVNTKFICNELLQIPSLKKYYKSPIRQKGNIFKEWVTFQEVIRSMVTKAPGFLDLDQFLEYFSIKGVVTNIILEDEKSQKSSQEQNEVNMAHKLRKLEKIKSLQNLRKSKRKRTNKGKPSRKIITDFKEFNITKKQKQTIREKRLKQMIIQKQQKQLNQLNKKFKANPIPAQLNPERLKAQQKKLDLRKKRRKQEMEKQKQQSKELLNYLKANTKLFQTKQKIQNVQTNQKNIEHFVHKPVPWFVQQKMLSQIQNQKSQRRKKIMNDTKLKYVRSWNKLPDMFFQDENKSDQSLQNDLKEMQGHKNQQYIKAKPVPDFAYLHAQFQRSLQKRKKQFHPTKIQQFQLTSPKNKRENESDQITIKRSNYTMHKDQKQRWRQTLHSPPPNVINTKKKTEDWIRLNQQRLAEKQRKKRQQESKEIQRINKQKNFAKFMSKKLTKQVKQMPNLQEKTSQKLKNFKKVMHMLKQQHQTELSQIYAKVLQRPFLFQLQDIQNKPKTVHKTTKKKVKGINEKQKQKVKTIQPISMQESDHEQNNLYYAGGTKQKYNNQGQMSYEDQQQENVLNRSF